MNQKNALLDLFFRFFIFATPPSNGAPLYHSFCLLAIFSCHHLIFEIQCKKKYRNFLNIPIILNIMDKNNADHKTF
jgi:hypothetical protein